MKYFRQILDWLGMALGLIFCVSYMLVLIEATNNAKCRFWGLLFPCGIVAGILVGQLIEWLLRKHPVRMFTVALTILPIAVFICVIMSTVAAGEGGLIKDTPTEMEIQAFSAVPRATFEAIKMALTTGKDLDWWFRMAVIRGMTWGLMVIVLPLDSIIAWQRNRHA